MNISKEGIALIKRFEGCETKAYQDSVGVWTIGFGHTKDVKEGDEITTELAEIMLEEEMPEYEGYINDMVKGDVIFCATGVTDGDIVKGIKDRDDSFESETFVLHKSSNTNKKITNINKK